MSSNPKNSSAVTLTVPETKYARTARSWPGSNPLAALDELLDEKKNPFAWVVKLFLEYLQQSPDTAPAVCAVRALTEYVKLSKANTMMEFELDLRKAVDSVKSASNVLSVSSGCDLFARYVSRTVADIPKFEECRKILVERGEQYTKQSLTSREKISKYAANFIRDGVTVLTHGFSRVVLSILLSAQTQRRRFSVIVTEARPDQIGYMTAQVLQEANIPVTVVVDSAVGYVMDKVDLVLVGAEGIVENGGIINKLGTYQISLVTAAFKKPFYVAAESFKFMRVYPLNQRDIAEIKQEEHNFKFLSEFSPIDISSLENVKTENPTNDYTPPSCITLLFTELGVLTPSAVSDELIKLYY